MSDYHDVEGNPVSLANLCRLDPTWAANRIRASIPLADVARVLRASLGKKTGPVDQLKDALHALFAKYPRLREEVER